MEWGWGWAGVLLLRKPVTSLRSCGLKPPFGGGGTANWAELVAARPDSQWIEGRLGIPSDLVLLPPV